MKQPSYHIKPTTNTYFCSKFTPKFIIKFDPVLPSKPGPLTFKPCTFHSPNSSSSPSETLISILRIVPDWADRVKERGMQKNRTLYNQGKWVEHRSSLRRHRHVLSSLTSRVILSLVPPVIAFTTFALIASYNSAVLTHWLPEFFPVLRASSLPYQLMGLALALLLVLELRRSMRGSWRERRLGQRGFLGHTILLGRLWQCLSALVIYISRRHFFSIS